MHAQLAIRGPENASREDIEGAIAHRLREGRDQKGYTIRWAEWRGREVSPEMQPDFFRIFRHFAADADQEISAPSAVSATELFDRESESEDED